MSIQPGQTEDRPGATTSGVLPQAGIHPIVVRDNADASAATVGQVDLAGIWLDGDVLACACPQCHAPMSIRLWLMVADCWMCGTSIELTEEQERAALLLLEKRERGQQVAATSSRAKAPAAATAPTKPAVAPEARLAKPAVAPSSAALPRKPQPAVAPAQRSRRPPAVPLKTIRKRAPHDWLRDLPAWLVSLIFHIVAILLLGLLTVGDGDQANRDILLTATMGKVGEEGGEKKPDEHADAVVIEDPGKEQADQPKPSDPETPPEPPKPPQLDPPRAADLLATAEDQHARDLPQYERVRAALTSTSMARMFEGRDPRVRTQVVLAEGGSMYTEAAVAQGLRWLSRHQAEDGHWSFDEFDEHGDCNERCNGLGHGRSDTGATGLALLPLLGAGQTHTRGIYKNHVGRGLAWLVKAQKSNGDLRGEGTGRMYAHGIAAIALCEGYALSQDTRLRAPAQRAVDFIVKAQHTGSRGGSGGWRYDPGQPGDTSVVGWQLMALRSGRMAGLRVPDEVFERASNFLDHVQHGEHGGLYAYQRGRSPEPAMIAEGLLCRQYLGWPADHPGLDEGVTYLLEYELPSVHDPNIYYWYYATQVMHHVGGPAWEQWNNSMREALVRLQNRRGHEAGSWDPMGGAIGGHDVHVGGRLYMTALAICTLEVYYRHLPIYRSIEVE